MSLDRNPPEEVVARAKEVVQAFIQHDFTRVQEIVEATPAVQHIILPQEYGERTLVDEAVWSGNDVLATWLLEHGAPLETLRGPVLCELVRSGLAGAVRAALARGADPRATNSNGLTPLHLCNDADIARLLIERGADVNAARNSDRLTPLMWGSDLGFMRLLLEQGADPNTHDVSGKTPAHHLLDSEKGDGEPENAEWVIARLELLRSFGARFDCLDNAGKSLLFNKQQEKSVTLYLARLGAPLDVVEKEKGDTALHVAIKEAHHNKAIALIEAGASVLIKNKAGDVATEYASIHGMEKLQPAIDAANARRVGARRDALTEATQRRPRKAQRL